MDVFDAFSKGKKTRMFNPPFVKNVHCLFKQPLCHTLVPQVWTDS
jgi:hypothetical protein